MSTCAGQPREGAPFRGTDPTSSSPCPRGAETLVGTVHSQGRAHGRSKPLSSGDSHLSPAHQPRRPHPARLLQPSCPLQHCWPEDGAADATSDAEPFPDLDRHIPSPDARFAGRTERSITIASRWRPWEPCPSLALGHFTNCRRGHDIRQGAGPPPFTHCPASAPPPLACSFRPTSF